ncbi:Flap endonuclease GEN 1 [Tetrabaena socialis]|uniref:Flap endonuclease GEN 1 n=1 Tax=Tetrabaena socialis TaxID=47790 RepID=A0A2J7ZKI4_9CHLO|nr:Flap endonuclease GEN 1 [Tetrabaena socialis]|eukprot:PNH00777.1 Flap endonuclease GEN 1 [Tetrabaena socialis]
MLRYGITPVFVLEGDAPDAKMGRLQQRSLARGFGGAAGGNRRGGPHDILGRRVVELLDLMGLPHVDAPGEAEAMCAALTAVGLADAAVTTDVDCLLFGATAVYKDLGLSMDTPRNNALEKVEAVEAAKRCFGLRGGGGCAQALQAVALLAGCDYQVDGGRGVGVGGALDAVQALTLGRQVGKGRGVGGERSRGGTAAAAATPSFRADVDTTLAAFRSETQRATRMAAQLRRDGGALSSVGSSGASGA